MHLKIPRISGLFLTMEFVDGEDLESLLRRIGSTRRVSHPNVCRVYDLGEAQGQLARQADLAAEALGHGAVASQRLGKEL